MMKVDTHKKMLMGAVFSGGLLSVTMAHGQEAQQDPRYLLELDVLTVSGQKISRDIQETVDSVEVITSEDLIEEARSNDLYQLFDKSANITRAGSYDFSIRGIQGGGPTASHTGVSAIGVFVDGAQQTARSTQAGAITTWDVDQVEILRGPQSTTSGRSSLAGAVIVNTKDPVFVEEGAAKIGFSDNGGYEFGLVQNKPVTDNIAVRVAIETTGNDGFVSAPSLNDDDFDKEQSYLGRGKLLYSGDDGDEFILSLAYSKFKDFGDDLVKDTSSDRESEFNSDTIFVTDTLNLSGHYSLPINDNVTLESITSGSTSKFDRLGDSDQAAGNSLIRQEIDEYVISQELRLNYQDENLNSVFGAYIAMGETDDYFDIDAASVPVAGLGSILISTQQGQEEEFENFALFFNADYKLAEKFTILSGARLDYETRKNAISTTVTRAANYGAANNVAIDGYIASVVGDGTENGKTDSLNLLPKIGGRYDWSSNISTGFQYQLGYRPGGVSTNITRGTAVKYEEEYTHNYELSFRSNWLDNRLSVNGNLFYTDWKDQQVRVQGNLGPYDRTIQNAGSSHLYGGELQAAYAISRKLDIDGYIGYTETEFDEFISGSGADYSGNAFQYARNVTAGFGVNYRPWEGYFVNTNVVYAGSAQANVKNSAELDPYTVVNLKAGYEEENWALNFYVSNLFDETYVTEDYQGEATFAGVILGDPRVVGFNLVMNW